ncbi:polysaccharide deacetylase family protein [Martelella radicis]|uniref:Chitooligosaccharide deacetylase n=1 Tax=Martelella radicis TaxID=1397476 RepID=A0A7W6PC41_9HYPH|nr:polysaccharide deacetylase family protein [Martelella radicis]MBB4124136.1 peptidoglycan/xylan/chitin deacetylase (PgdA/CDA1 family) [Martelella radicis]
MIASNPRIPYRLADDHDALPAFNDRRIVVQFVVNMEHWRFDHAMPRGISTPPQGRAAIPDIPNFAWAEYGMRVGMKRFFDLFRSTGLPASASLNANVIDVYPECAEQSVALGWEFIGHGLYQQAVHTEPNEAEIIERSLERLKAYTGVKTRGWLGPGLGESEKTPDILKGLGIEYLLDWVLDDRPCRMETKNGPLLSVPYTLELNDSTVYAVEKHRTGEFLNRVKRTLYAFEREEASGTVIMTIALHPHLMGVPHRITELVEMAEALMAHPDVTFAQPGEVASWFEALCSDTAKQKTA